jgi:hypothetical protein
VAFVHASYIHIAQWADCLGDGHVLGRHDLNSRGFLGRSQADQRLPLDAWGLREAADAGFDQVRVERPSFQ